MPTYCHTFRIEAIIDLTRLLALILPLDPEFLILGVTREPYGGAQVDCCTILTRNNMLHRIAEVPDGHVMAQTLETSDAQEPLNIAGAR